MRWFDACFAVRTLAIMAFFSSAGPAWAELPGDKSMDKVWVAPARTGLWVAFQLQGGAATPGTFRAGFRAAPKDWSWLTDAPGRAVAVTVVADRLYAAFEDGPIRRYDRSSPTTSTSLRILPKPYALERLVADATGKRLFALGKCVSAADTTTGPTPSERVFEYVRGQWSTVADMPVPVGLAGGVRFAARTRQFDALARKGAKSFVRWTWQDGAWTGPAAVELDRAVDRYWLIHSTIGGQLIMTTVSRRADGTELHVFDLDVDEPAKAGRMLELPKAAHLDPQRLDVGFAGGEIVVGWLGDKGVLHLARFDPTGRTAGPIEDLPTAKTPPTGESPQMMHLLLFATLVLLVFFTRGFRPAEGTSLPEGTVLADYWRRLAAAVIDFLPVSWIGMRIWEGDFSRMPQGMSASEWLRNYSADPRMVHIGLYILCGFAAYCIVTELIWSTTPGKKLLGIRVRSIRSADGRPTPLQIVIRNLLKIVELSSGVLLVVMFFTSLRQRLGDLLAGTVVVRDVKPTGDPSNHDRQP